jgi:hypothetical protein
MEDKRIMVRRQISSSRFHNNPRASSLALLLLLCMGLSACPNTGQERSGNPAPISPADLPRFTGGNPPYADTNYHDGRFRPAVGVRNIQVLRGNRKHPEQLYDTMVPMYRCYFCNMLLCKHLWPDIRFEYCCAMTICCKLPRIRLPRSLANTVLRD